ncbi:MAG: hypothetical protein WAM88_02900 [Nitrososphaeraceae archaeon]
MTLSICQVTSGHKTPELVAAVSDAGGPGLLAAFSSYTTTTKAFSKEC